MWRRVGYPVGGNDGGRRRGGTVLDYVQDPLVGSATIFVGAGDLTGTNMSVNRLLIDGEPVEWAGHA